MTGDIGITETKYFQFEGLKLESGKSLSKVQVAYETYGKLNSDKSNAILILHALTGDAHAAGFHAGEAKPGWWDSMIGPGKAFDTDKYFVISTNVLGGCQGTTGPASTNPETGKPYGLDFPFITISDMVKVQKKLIDHLGIHKLLSAAGGSMGGMQAISWLTDFGSYVHSIIPIATSAKHSPQQIAFHEVGRQAIMSDPNWNNGDYYNGEPPAKGLALARMIGHITYMSDTSMEEKFGRGKKSDKLPDKFDANFEVERYLHYRGDSFVKRFDANTYLYVTKAMDYYDSAPGSKLEDVWDGKKASILVIAFKSDWLYPAYHSKEIAKAGKLGGLDVTYVEIESTYGHDAFLLELEEETHYIKHFLKKVERNIHAKH